MGYTCGDCDHCLSSYCVKFSEVVSIRDNACSSFESKQREMEEIVDFHAKIKSYYTKDVTETREEQQERLELWEKWKQEEREEYWRTHKAPEISEDDRSSYSSDPETQAAYQEWRKELQEQEEAYRQASADMRRPQTDIRQLLRRGKRKLRVSFFRFFNDRRQRRLEDLIRNEMTEEVLKRIRSVSRL